MLGRPALDFLNVKDGGVYIDATFGAGGYTRAILAAANCKVIAIDRDPNAIALGRELAAIERPADVGRRPLLQSRHDRARCRLRQRRRRRARPRRLVDAARHRRARLLVPPRRPARHAHGRARARAPPTWSHAAERARSCQHHLPARRGAPFARRRPRHRQGARRGADRDDRARSPISSLRSVRARPGDIHPATRTFQALRIFVNDELGELARALAAAERILKAGGRLVVVSFHSLEDRIVKTFLRRARATRARLAPCARSQTRCAELPPAHQAAGDRRRRRKLRAIRAPVPPSCAPPSAPTRPRSAATPPICCRACRRSPTC